MFLIFSLEKAVLGAFWIVFYQRENIAFLFGSGSLNFSAFKKFSTSVGRILLLFPETVTTIKKNDEDCFAARAIKGRCSNTQANETIKTIPLITYTKLNNELFPVHKQKKTKTIKNKIPETKIMRSRYICFVIV